MKTHLSKPTLTTQQKEGVSTIVEAFSSLKGFILADAMGLGKEQPFSEPVVTPYGIKTMGDLSVGDLVIGSSGNPVKVMGVYYQGEKDVYEITFTDQTKVRCGLDHLWTVRDYNMVKRGQGWKTLSLGQIIQMSPLYKDNTCKFEVPTLKNPVNYLNNQTIKDAYLMGALIANGCLNQSYVTLTINNLDTDIMDRIGGVWRDKKGCKVTTIYKYVPIIKELQLDKISRLKFIPDRYKYTTVKNRKLLLKGLMDCDGSNFKNRVTYHTTSKQLAYDVAELVRSLAGIAVVRKYVRKNGKPTEYQVNVKTNFCPFYSKRKSKNWKYDKKTIGNKILSIKKTGREKSVCIKVAALDSLYTTSNFKMTHNTAQAIEVAKRGQKAGPALIICPAYLILNWKDELLMWGIKQEHICIIDKGSQILVDNNYYIVSYTLSVKDAIFKQLFKKEFSLIIADESHYLKSWNSARSRRILGTYQNKKTHLMNRTKRILLLTGTPVLNNVEDLYNIIKRIAPHLIPYTKQEFILTFAGTYMFTPYGLKHRGVRNVEKLKEMIKPVMLRRTGIEGLPERIDKYIEIDRDR